MGSHNLFQGHTSTDLETSHYPLPPLCSKRLASKPLIGRSRGIFNIQSTVDHSPYCSLEDCQTPTSRGGGGCFSDIEHQQLFSIYFLKLCRRRKEAAQM